MTTGEIENWKDWLAGSLVDAEPEAVARLLKICVSAEGLFHGDRQAARRWLQNPAYGAQTCNSDGPTPPP